MITINGLDLAGRFINISAWGAPHYVRVLTVHADGSARVASPAEDGGSDYWTCPASIVATGARDLMPTAEDSARLRALLAEDAQRDAEQNGF